MVALFVVVWIIAAYLALPRLHRILTGLYVPNYFIGRTRNADGLLSDPVNLAMRGSEAQLHAAMTAAGWTLADDITPRSVWKIVIAVLTRQSYKHAPVSSLFLFGRRQDFAYQKEINGNPSKRHHVRFWRCPQGWLLPGGHRVDWLAAGTYDKSVGLSLFTLQITHKIDTNTDIERDYVVKTVTEVNSQVKVTNLKDFSSGYHARNGGGDMIQTDGDLPVLELGKVRAENVVTASSQLILDATQHETHPELHNTLIWRLWSRRPPQISFGVVLVALTMVITGISTVVEFINLDEVRQRARLELQEDNLSAADMEVAVDWVISSSIIVTLAWLLLMVFLVRWTFRGSDRSRIMLMMVASVAALVSSLSLTVGKITWSAAGILFFISLNIVVVLLFSSDSARRFTLARSHKKPR